MDNITTKELYLKRQKEYQDALIEQRVYAVKLEESRKAVKAVLDDLLTALDSVQDQEMAISIRSAVETVDVDSITVSQIEELMLFLHTSYQELDRKAREILNG